MLASAAAVREWDSNGTNFGYRKELGASTRARTSRPASPLCEAPTSLPSANRSPATLRRCGPPGGCAAGQGTPRASLGTTTFTCAAPFTRAPALCCVVLLRRDAAAIGGASQGVALAAAELAGRDGAFALRAMLCIDEIRGRRAPPATAAASLPPPGQALSPGYPPRCRRVGGDHAGSRRCSA